MKFYKLPRLARDVTGLHYRPVLSDVFLPKLSERRRRLKFRLTLVKSLNYQSLRQNYFLSEIEWVVVRETAS